MKTKRYNVVKVCKLEYENDYPECSDNNQKYPDLVQYIQSNNEFEVYIVNEDNEYCLADYFFYVKKNIKSFIIEEEK